MNIERIDQEKKMIEMAQQWEDEVDLYVQTREVQPTHLVAHPIPITYFVHHLSIPFITPTHPPHDSEHFPH